MMMHNQLVPRGSSRWYARSSTYAPLDSWAHDNRRHSSPQNLRGGYAPGGTALIAELMGARDVRQNDDLALEDLRRETLALMCAALAGIAVLLTFCIEANLSHTLNDAWLLVFALLGVSWLARWLVG